MKRTLLLLVLVIIATGVDAQSDNTEIIRLFIVEAPPGHENPYPNLSWSPDGSLVAIHFAILDERRQPLQTLWQVYAVGSGELLYECEHFIAWYAHSSRALIRATSDSPPTIVDARTGISQAILEDAGKEFSPGPIVDVIINMDEANTLRIYDPQTGEHLFHLENVTSAVHYSPDKSQFVLNYGESSAMVYDAANYELLHLLPGYRAATTELLPFAPGSERNTGWSPDGRRLVVMPQDLVHGYLGPFYVWTPGEGLSAPFYNVTDGIVWSPDGSRIAVPSDYMKVRIYDADTGELLDTIRGFTAFPTRVRQWNDRYLISTYGSYYDSWQVLSLWEFEQEEFVFNRGLDLGHQYHIIGDTIETFEPGIGHSRFDLNTGEMVYEVKFDQIIPYLSPDWRWVVGLYSLDVYELEPFRLVDTLDGHTRVSHVSWSPDSLHFASADHDEKFIIVWEIRDTNQP